MLAIAPTMAAEMNGKIKSIDMKKHELTMEDGTSVMVKPRVRLHGLRAGEDVRVTTDHNNMATSIKRMK